MLNPLSGLSTSVLEDTIMDSKISFDTCMAAELNYNTCAPLHIHTPHTPNTPGSRSDQYLLPTPERTPTTPHMYDTTTNHLDSPQVFFPPDFKQSDACGSNMVTPPFLLESLPDMPPDVCDLVQANNNLTHLPFPSPAPSTHSITGPEPSPSPIGMTPLGPIVITPDNCLTSNTTTSSATSEVDDIMKSLVHDTAETMEDGGSYELSYTTVQDVEYDDIAKSIRPAAPKHKVTKGRVGRPIKHDPDDDKLSEEAKQKKARRRDQNRRAAQKCRVKKRAAQDVLFVDYSNMKQENVELRQSVQSLEKEKEELERLLAEHMKVCTLQHNLQHTTAAPQLPHTITTTAMVPQQHTTTLLPQTTALLPQLTTTLGLTSLGLPQP